MAKKDYFPKVEGDMIIWLTNYKTNLTAHKTALGLTDWIAKTRDEYAEIAVAKAGQYTELKALRNTLRERFVSSPVVKDYARAVESAYADMWAKWIA